MANEPSAPVVECRGLSKVFKDFWMRPRVRALDGLDLAVRPREVFGLLGPNGSGKSTTIKLVLGLLFPTRGRVRVFGRLPSDVRIKSRIGYLPEESYLYRFLNARETLDYYGRLFHFDRRTRRKRIEMLLEMVGLEGVQRRAVGEYSKGMQRRIGLAQALINDPDLLILDEPTTGLDPIGARQIKDLIVQLRERGKTVFLCSHLLADVEDVCDRVVVLYGGKVRAKGTIAQLLTESDALLMESGPLPPPVLEKVKRVIEEEGHTRLRKAEAPRKKLETLFLEIVQRARDEGAETHGARGGAVARFLRADAPAASEGQHVIEELVRTPAPVEAPPPKAEPDAGVLAGLTAASEPNGARAGAPSGTAHSGKPPPPEPPKTSPTPVDQGIIDELIERKGKGDGEDVS